MAIDGVPTSWEDLLADERQRRIAEEFVARGGVTHGAEDRAPYEWETDGTRRPGQDALTAANLPGLDLVHQSTPTTTQDRFQSLSHAVQGIPRDVLADFAAGTDANMRRILGEPVAQVMPKASAPPKPQKAAAGKAPPDPEEIKALHAFARARWPKEPEDVIAAITPANLKEIRTTLDAKYGIQSREGLAADAGARDEAKTKQGDVHFWAKMQQDAEQFGVSDATRRYIAEQALKAAQAARDEAAATKEKEKSDAVNVPGFDVAPGATPTPKDAETIKAINGANKELAKSVTALRALHRRYGPSYAGAEGTNMGQIINAIKISAKTIAELGALSGDDNRLMGALAGGDPSTIESVAKSVFGVDNTEAAMDGLMQWADRRISAAAEARGYRPKAATPQRTTPDKVLPKDAAGNPTLDAPPPPGKVRVIINGKPMLFPPEQVEAVKKRAKVRGDKIEVHGG